jgi:protein ImuA
MSSARSATVRRLAQRIREMEEQAPRSRAAPAAGIPNLKLLLSRERLPAGSVVEVLAAGEGSGIWTVGLLLALQACSDKVLVIIDGQHCFYPPGAVRLGMDLERTLIVRPTKPRDAGVALNEALRCPAVGAVLAECPRLAWRDGHKLQMAAEVGGGVGILLRSPTAQRESSLAGLRLLVAPRPSTSTRRRLRVEALRWRGGDGGPPVLLEIDDATGDVRVSTGMATAKARARSARAAQ